MRARILGSGTSSGVPRIGGAGGKGDWGDCDPNEPRNRRTRASVLIESATTRILVDTSPDMREQLLAAGVADIDAVVWTHDHADHCHGIDDLRQIFHARGRPVIGYARPDTLAALESRFAYAFAGRDGYPPTVEGRVLADELTIGDIDIRVVDQPHAAITTAGLRFEAGDRSIIYATDFNILTDDMKSLYQDTDVWIVDALRRKPHPSHPMLSTILEAVAELRPIRTALIHMDSSMDYAQLVAELPPGIEPGYDGLELTA